VQPSASRRSTVLAISLLVALTVGDSVLAVILFDLFDERLSLFVNQGTALVYIVVSLIALVAMRNAALLPARVVDSSQPVIDAEGNLVGALRPERKVPWYYLVVIGLLNGSANFLQAISQPHTPGLSQTLLPLLGIPLVLVLVWLLFHRRPSLAGALGAALIIGGGAVSALRTVLATSTSDSGSGDSPIVVYGWAIALFGSAQVFLAFEKVFEERVFSDFERLNPMVMFCWTLVTQFLLGWALYPLQTFPAFGGISISDLPDVLWDGVRCTVGMTAAGCGPIHAIIFWCGAPPSLCAAPHTPAWAAAPSTPDCPGCPNIGSSGHTLASDERCLRMCLRAGATALSTSGVTTWGCGSSNASVRCRWPSHPKPTSDARQSHVRRTPVARQSHASRTPVARQSHASRTPVARQSHASRTP
jgi:hypothetical protein